VLLRWFIATEGISSCAAIFGNEMGWAAIAELLFIAEKFSFAGCSCSRGEFISDVKSSMVNSFEPEIEVWLVELLGFKVMKLFICVPLGTFGEWHLLCLFCSRINLFEEVFFRDFSVFGAISICELQFILVVFRVEFNFA
jgi:hypothetical protein